MQERIFIVAWIGALAVPLFLIVWAIIRRRAPWRAMLLLVLPYGLAVWGVLVEPALLIVRHVAVIDADWKAPPLRIGVITDTHVPGPHMSPQRVAEIVATLNREQPDVVVLLGDYVGSHEPAALRAQPNKSAVLRGIAAFSGLKSQLGTFAAIGNHDTWYGAPSVRTALRKAGARVVENNGEPLVWKGAPVWIGGLGDLEPKGEGADFPRALAGAPPDASVLMIAHWPDVFDYMPARVALTLVGHTHCGQVNVPFFGRLGRASPAAARYPCGLYDVGGRKLYVSGGVGTSILPIRFGAPPEIAIVTISGAP